MHLRQPALAQIPPQLVLTKHNQEFIRRPAAQDTSRAKFCGTWQKAQVLCTRRYDNIGHLAGMRRGESGNPGTCFTSAGTGHAKASRSWQTQPLAVRWICRKDKATEANVPVGTTQETGSQLHHSKKVAQDAGQIPTSSWHGTVLRKRNKVNVEEKTTWSDGAHLANVLPSDLTTSRS